MSETIIQEFKDEIDPVRIDLNNGNGQIVTIVDWNAEANSRMPQNATNIQWSFTLEYLSAHYYFPSLDRIPASELPTFKLSDTDSIRQTKSIEFKRKYSPNSGYAIQFMLWRMFAGSWREKYSARDWLQYLGLEGHISLIYPYFLDEPGVMFGGVRHKIGMSITPRSLQGDDYIEITGGFSGVVSYVPQNPGVFIVESEAGAVEVGREPIRILAPNYNRAALYISNAGTTRLYFKFTNFNTGILPKTSPFIEPGESLSVEHGKLFYSGGNPQFLPTVALEQITQLAIWGIREGGPELVTFQELEFD